MRRTLDLTVKMKMQQQRETYIKARHVNSVPHNDVDEVIGCTVLPEEDLCVKDF